MPVVTREELWNDLKVGRIAPIYVLHGQEKYLRDLAAKTITDRSFLENDLRDFNEGVFSLNDVDNLKSAVAAAQQLPMMSARRVIRVNDVRITTSGRDTLKEEDEGFLKDYLTRPAETSVVVFVADELNGNRKITKLLKQYAEVIEFEPLSEVELFRRASQEILDAGAKADERTIYHIVTLVGQDVLRLTNEIRKLSTASLPMGLITIELVDELVGYKREIENWTLTNNLLAGKRSAALQILRKLLDDGAEPVMILGLIGSGFHKLLLAKELMARGIGRQEVIGIAKPPYGHYEEFFAFSIRANSEKLAGALKRIADADLSIKTSLGGSGPSATRMQIEMLVCELALL
jgi:DNA polymerase-3 subunit delta